MDYFLSLHVPVVYVLVLPLATTKSIGVLNIQGFRCLKLKTRSGRGVQHIVLLCTSLQGPDALCNITY